MGGRKGEKKRKKKKLMERRTARKRSNGFVNARRSKGIEFIFSFLLFLCFFFVHFAQETETEMAAGDAEDLASVATRAEERLKALESAVFKEREEVQKKKSFFY